jgi:NADPH:quinone reductase-like Zn-dependent oxidoreductase
MDFGSFALSAKEMLWPSALGGGKRKYQSFGVENKKEDFELIARWMVAGKIKTVMEDDNRFDLANGGKVYMKLNIGRTRGKIVIKIGADDQ